MQLDEMLDDALLGDMLDQGYVHLQVHPTEPLCILNYTDKCAWEGMWNDVTLACRGLIYDAVSYKVLARPFSKFFNYEQFGPEHKFPTGRVTVTNKQDGSLGILYPLPDGTYAVATRGSFASDQAIHATRVFNERYAEAVKANVGDDITFLFEIIYPENRIVLNYGDMDDLVLLGGVRNDNGHVIAPDTAKYLLRWTGPVTEIFYQADSFLDALSMPPRENAEGIVVRFLEDDLMVKVKQADYVALHRIITGMTERSVWEAMAQGKTREQIKEPLPEEFHPWVDEVTGNLLAQTEDILLDVYKAYCDVLYELGTDFTRKDFALAVKDHSLKGYLFKYLDGQSLWDVVWKSIKPDAVRSLVTASLEE